MPSRIEPCLLDAIPLDLADLVAELTAAAERLTGRLHPQTAASLAELVRVMNCYYSNLIEGHHTKPRDIERALADELDSEERQRNLQLEARAHIRVQRQVDRMHAQGTLPEPASADFLGWLHREFYREAPEAMLWIEQDERRFRMEPGAFRSLSTQDVVVGRHVPPGSAHVAAFMRHFEQRYRLVSLGKGGRIVAMAAAHHRLNYIHPFPDGNGRVSRLMSHAMGLAAGIGAAGLWSVSRGLARGLQSRREYKQMMDHADSPRQGDLDGRGNLSQKALAEFIQWFLRVCLDQVEFMAGLFEFDRLASRLKHYGESRSMRPEAFHILERVLLQGEMPRGEAERITGLKERSARSVLAALVNDGILRSATPKGPVSLHFGGDAVDILFPRLFAEG
ncbi:MAG: Fic family protein [Verrucomicrobia bacterium]|nr:MAG: Fic family protein [Verrucomicrobiota bacterium]